MFWKELGGKRSWNPMVWGWGGNGRNEASKVSKTRPCWALTWVMVRNVDLGI